MAFNFTGLGTAKADGRFPKLDHGGKFKVTVAAIKEALAFTTKEQSYVIEVMVEEVFWCSEDARPEPMPKVGERRSVTINGLDSRDPDNRDRAFVKLRSFLAAAYSGKFGAVLDSDTIPEGEDPDFWEQLAGQSLEDDGAGLEGETLIIQCQRIDIKRTKQAIEKGNPKSK